MLIDYGWLEDYPMPGEISFGRDPGGYGVLRPTNPDFDYGQTYDSFGNVYYGNKMYPQGDYTFIKDRDSLLVFPESATGYVKEGGQWYIDDPDYEKYTSVMNYRTFKPFAENQTISSYNYDPKDDEGIMRWREGGGYDDLPLSFRRGGALKRTGGWPVSAPSLAWQEEGPFPGSDGSPTYWGPTGDAWDTYVETRPDRLQRDRKSVV